MEDNYSVATNNRFAFFMDDEDDPGDMILQESRLLEKSPKKLDASPTQKKPEKPLKGKDQKVANQLGKKPQGDNGGGKRKEVQFNAKGQQKDKPTERPPRDNRRQPSGQNSSSVVGGENRPPRQNRSRGRLPSREKQEGGVSSGGGGGAATDDVSQRDSRSRPRPRSERNNWDNNNRDHHGERDEGGERSGFRSSRPPRGGGGFRGGKREFERRSGSDKTSVKPLDKKEGAGSHNWGTVKDEMITSGADDWPSDEMEQPELILEPPSEPTEETKTDKPEGEGVEEGTATTTEEEEVKEKEEEIMTLDEYKAMMEKKRFVPLFKERKAGENEDTTRWKDTFVYERTDSELIPGTREVVEKYKTSGRVKTAVESNFFFKDTSRFGRGGGPGKRGPDRRQFEEKQGQESRERRPRRSEGGGSDRERDSRPRRSEGGGGDRERDSRPRRSEGGGGDRERDSRPRRSEGGGDRERRPRRFVDGRPRDRSNFNVEDEKDFPSLGTVSA